jgi:hypothetical protein
VPATLENLVETDSLPNWSISHSPSTFARCTLTRSMTHITHGALKEDHLNRKSTPTPICFRTRDEDYEALDPMESEGDSAILTWRTGTSHHPFPISRQCGQCGQDLHVSCRARWSIVADR